MNNCRSPFGCQCAQLRERYPPGQTPELPVHVVLVPLLLVPPLLVLPLLVLPLLVSPLLRFPALVPPLLRVQALVGLPSRWCNVDRIAFVIFWIVLGSFVFASCGG